MRPDQWDFVYLVMKRWWVRLHDKGGKHHEMPCDHTFQDWFDAYIESVGIEGEKARSAVPHGGGADGAAEYGSDAAA